jgi:replication fork clamp-binding protein CrfC
MLKGQDVTLKYGYVGVKLRSQQDIKENITIEKALQQEKEFFASHPVYSSVPGEIFGTQVLTSKLTNILYRHIRSFLPKLMTELNSRSMDLQKELNKLGPGLPTEDKVVE